MPMTVLPFALLLALSLAVLGGMGTSPVEAAKNAPPEPIALWPGTAPGETGSRGEEHDSTKHDPSAAPGSEVIRLTNVSQPTITVFRPAPDKANGTAVIVCPGGGYSILAYDLEGTEICAWLNSIGVTGILLKYRVPGRLADTYRAPLQDAQRALSVVRHRAKEWGIDPKRVGILGFSAGGHLSAVASTTDATARSYTTVDAADQESCHPDFALLIYPAYLVVPDDLSKLAPDLKVSAATPPTFLVQTMDDNIKVENVLTYALSLKNAKVPVELHVYPNGGHGYGLRRSANSVSHWPERAAEWLASRGLLKRP